MTVVNSDLYVANHGVWLYMVTNSLLQYMLRNMLRYMWLNVLRGILRHTHCNSTLFGQTHVGRWYTDDQLLEYTLWSMRNQGAAEMLKKIKRHSTCTMIYMSIFMLSVHILRTFLHDWLPFHRSIFFSWTCVPSTLLFFPSMAAKSTSPHTPTPFHRTHQNWSHSSSNMLSLQILPSSL